MLKKTIKYKNLFTDEEMEEDFYFHLSKAEIAELELSVEGGLSEALKRIVEAKDNKKILEEFKHIILLAYGVRSEDGRFFKKTQQLRDEFESSEAYSELFMEILTDEDKAAEFVNGIIPADLAEEAAKLMAQENKPAELTAVPKEDDKKDPGPVVVSGQRAESVDTPSAQDDETGKGDN